MGPIFFKCRLDMPSGPIALDAFAFLIAVSV